MSSNTLKKLFLNDLHLKYGAKFAPFSGYNMPINYKEGIIKEHLHTRKYVSLFDVSHMGQILIPVTDINSKKLEKIIPLDLYNFQNNKSSYSFILNQKGGIIDDIIISKIKYSDKYYYFIVYNSSRKSVDEKLFLQLTLDPIILSNNVLLAIQGPLSSKILSSLNIKINNFSFMSINTFKYMDSEIIISRTGYTGEDGFELSIPNNIAENFFHNTMKNNEIILCGLGCRDTLRIEAGLSLYGNELNENITPVEANLTWALSKKRLSRGDFNGFEIMNEQIIKNKFYKKVGIISKSKSILRSEMEIFDMNKKNIGKLTSGGFSPSLNKSIGIAYIDNILNNNVNKIYCSIRDNLHEVLLTELPFLNHNYRRY